ncbi:hypothetical protein GCM10008014_09080 [Paenibacillus silvae]|uniref:GIY-YIG domain-containing protein n=1 Tax=Paenibacillus silvae TaxID=1325358 RepID=A0ABQ1Z3D7_9BACL|nr:hypothetical protein [Paenibacillus silvae]GGH46416.1 hypothetical protein GCM10008014_09080 [Paenibacillus silvae]
MNNDLSGIKPLLYKILNDVNIYPSDEDIKVINRGNPHHLSFVEGNAYVYTFQYKGEFLKIGKAGSNSQPRFFSQHYHPSRTGSNLAKSILFDPVMKIYELNDDTVGDWIKKNVDRIDVEVNGSLGIFTLNLIESIMHCLYEPKYEGFKSQRITKIFNKK